MSGSGAGHIAKFLDQDTEPGRFVMYDAAKDLLYRDNDEPRRVKAIERIVGSLDALPFAEDTFDAVVSCGSLQWVNDLLGTMIQTRHVLKPDGTRNLIARTAFQLAETERAGGISPHVSPMVRHQDMGSLLTRAGFTLTTVDVDEITVNYPSMFELMEDLRAMGESNAVLSRNPYTSRDIFLAANEAYRAVYGNADGTIPATFQIIYMIGWKPHGSQPKPLVRGSAKHSFKDLDNIKTTAQDKGATQPGTDEKP
ncbi:hypothetical protein HDV03_005345 [Kappamyces sp. JEL0829]|nr:hypothetical protein HDV03_005345 [Kappamyces sp. JEL0829]